MPGTVQARTFHTWCLGFLQQTGVPIPDIDEDGCRQAVYRAFGRLLPEQRAALGQFDGKFVDEEIVQVIKHNGLTTIEKYLEFSRDRRPGLKQPGREAVWAVHEMARTYEREAGICRHSDVPLLALEALDGMTDPPQYRAIVIDEGQDCSPVMVCLARRLLKQSGGTLTVFADPAQGIYDCGFHWTQKALRPSGGNVKWLRTTYRTTREVFDLARPLLNGSEELQEDLAQLESPKRSGPRPQMVVTETPTELEAEMVERIAQEAVMRPANQIGMLAADWKTLRRFAKALHERQVPVALTEGGALRLHEPTVKLLTMQGV